MPGYMIVYEDRDGTPAVWHHGDECNAFAVRCEAREKLVQHVRAERAAGRVVTANDFRLVETRQVQP